MAREDMRLVEVMVMSPAARERVTDVLGEKELDYVVSDRTNGPEAPAIVSFPLPAHAVEPVQNRISGLDLSEDIYTVVVEPETIVSTRIENSEGLFRQVEGLGHQGVSRSELHSSAADLMPDLVIYGLMTGISAIVATTGVLLGSLAVLVGSMVIAPLIGPSMATSVATVIDDELLFRRSVRFQIIGGLIGVVSAVGFALFVRASSFVSSLDVVRILDVSNHTAPTFLLVVVALSAGVAGAISLSTSGTIGLVGVMIAAAVMPPVGVMGVGIAWLRPTVVFGSAAVVLLNVLSINLASIITLWYLGYHPESWTELRKARSTMLLRAILLTAAIVVLVVFLANLPGIRDFVITAIERIGTAPSAILNVPVAP